MDSSFHLDEIGDFWNWFLTHKTVLEQVVVSQQHPKTQYIVDGLNQYIVGMGKIKWEVAEPTTGSFSFILSPNSNKETLDITRAIIALAPKLNNWNFHHAYPATGDLILQVYDQQMELHEINAENWSVVLSNESVPQTELIIQAENVMHLDQDTQLVTVDLMLTQLLGEEVKIDRLAGFDLVYEFEADEKEMAFPFKNLPFEMNG